VEVQVLEQDQLDAGEAPHNCSTSATLDTKQLQYEGSYYTDATRCVENTKTVLGLRKIPFTLIDLLLSLPDPGPEMQKSVALITQLQLELQQLAETNPKAAAELAKIFSQRLNLREGMLLQPAASS